MDVIARPVPGVIHFAFEKVTMILWLVPAVLGAVFDVSGLGYRRIDASEQSNTFILDRSLDTVFVFDCWSDNFLVKGLGIDMTEYAVMQPNSIGFASYFLEKVEIVAWDSAKHVFQVFTLPKDYCNHKVAAFSPFAKQTSVVSWGVLKNYFNLCFVSQSPATNSSIEVTLRADTPATTAAYATPEMYSGGDFNGERIANKKSVSVRLTDGMIIRLHGATSGTGSEFESMVSPVDAQEWNDRAFVALPYYFLPVEHGYNYVSELGIGIESWQTMLFTLSNAAIVGVTISVVSMLAIIIGLIIFVRNLLKNKKHPQQTSELLRTYNS